MLLNHSQNLLRRGRASHHRRANPSQHPDGVRHPQLLLCSILCMGPLVSLCDKVLCILRGHQDTFPTMAQVEGLHEGPGRKHMPWFVSVPTVRVLQFAEKIPGIDVPKLLPRRGHCKPELGQQGLRVRHLHHRIRVHQHRHQHVEEDEQDQELEDQQPEVGQQHVHGLHLLDVELAHKDSPAHHDGPGLRAEGLYLVAEVAVGSGREYKEYQCEKHEEMENVHAGFRDRSDDNVELLVCLEGLEKLHHQNKVVDKHKPAQGPVQHGNLTHCPL
mmetsp:Transcript_27919/g.80465  ORF Transcript_27919/g.80465 Transcript_27919/m.80465 type:complete len:273 (+) Transcript_27919:82-900(+)